MRMPDAIARLFSGRVHELEQECADLRAIIGKDFDKVSITRMSFDEKTGFEASFHASAGALIASWGNNALKECGAKNYVELGLFHPEGGFLTITVQRRKGETPGAKAARLERELAELKATHLQAAE